MTQTTTKHGFAIVDNETGWTSHDVVAKARGTFGTKKIGVAVGQTKTNTSSQLEVILNKKMRQIGAEFI